MKDELQPLAEWQRREEYSQCFEAFQPLEHLVMHVFQTVTGEKHFIDTRCPFKGSLLDICDLIVAEVAKSKLKQEFFKQFLFNTEGIETRSFISCC